MFKLLIALSLFFIIEMSIVVHSCPVRSGSVRNGSLKFKVQRQMLSVYYESLCTDSIRFFRNQLPILFSSDFSDKVQVTLIPFGYATYAWDLDTSKWIFACEHGQRECFGNKIHNCAIKFYPDFNEHYKFINCTIVIGEDLTARARVCAQENSIQVQRILDCANDPLGDELLYQSARRTEALVPKATYIPHIVFENVHNAYVQNTAEFSLQKLLCDRYKDSMANSAVCK